MFRITCDPRMRPLHLCSVMNKWKSTPDRNTSRSDALSRTVPGSSMALFEPSCSEAYGEVFSDDSETDFCVLGYEGRKLTSVGKGKGGLQAIVKTFADDKVMYGLLRMIKTDDGGDSKRVKLVMITWVGENAPAMKKGAVTGHKPLVAELWKGVHISIHLSEREELESLATDIEQKITSAGGANYDLGNTRTGVIAGGTASIKAQSKQFFAAKDAETEIKNMTFGRVREGKEISACDLGGRSMVASASQAKGNTVGYVAPVGTAEEKENK